MNNAEYTDGSGPFEARYLAFLETITNLRPSLHRYSSRMTGSVLDGEDVVQDALLEAYRKLLEWAGVVVDACASTPEWSA
jgi:RNA polymerase sigma-70 factor (ECF subfamily)